MSHPDATKSYDDDYSEDNDVMADGSDNQPYEPEEDND